MDAAAGAVGIYVPAGDAAGLDPGYYTDALRMKLPTAGASVWYGQILVGPTRLPKHRRDLSSKGLPLGRSSDFSNKAASAVIAASRTRGGYYGRDLSNCMG